MKKLFSLALSVLMTVGCFSAAAPTASAAEETVTINVYNWGQYISDGSDGYLDVNAAFTEATGIKVNYMTFDSNESLYTKLKTGGSTFDVIIPSDYMVARLIEEDMLEPLNFSNIPNYKYIDEQFKNTSFDPTNSYSVPYTWGTVGLIYNTKYVDKITSWHALWDTSYAGKILMFDNPRDAFGIAELILGQSLNTEDYELLKDAAELLKQQKPVVQAYVMDQIYDKMIGEEAWIAPYYAGDFLFMLEENEDLAFILPEEGFNVFIDSMCIPKGSPNKEAAEAYINFLCDPEIAGQNMDYVGYSTPLSAAKEHMDPDLAESEIAYPNKEILSCGESYLALSDLATQQMDALWLDVKIDGNITGHLITGGIIVVLIATVMLCFHLRKLKRTAARRARKKAALLEQKKQED